MGEGFITRRGGGGQQTVKPIYNSFEASFTSLTLSVTNDSNSVATLYYSVVNTEPGPDQTNTFETEFQGKETKNITITGLTAGTTYTVYLKAIAIGEFPSETVSVPNLTTGVAMNATGGTTLEYNSGGKRYKSHTFNSNGTFTVTQLSNIGGTFNQLQYLVVAGGGGGGSGTAGGGGAGGYRSSVTGELSGRSSTAEAPLVAVVQSYSVTVGGGGNGASIGGFPGNGANSVFSTITSTGGGAGGEGDSNTSRAAGQNGGSGGGGWYYAPDSRNRGLGTVGQGNDGGQFTTSPEGGGGGGGAGAVGALGGGGAGGAGLSSTIRTGSGEFRGGGGGGGAGSFGGAGGIGGGASSTGGSNNQASGVANTGGGGAGGWTYASGVGGGGGSGIVIIRYEIAPTV